MPKYLFNFQATVEVEAADESAARDLLWYELITDVNYRAESVTLEDADVMLVEVDGHSPALMVTQ
jgi:hypothetical protein